LCADRAFDQRCKEAIARMHPWQRPQKAMGGRCPQPFSSFSGENRAYREVIEDGIH
jgi:hypothetical protein